MKRNLLTWALLALMVGIGIACDKETPDPNGDGPSYAERLKRDVDSLRELLNGGIIDSLRLVHDNPNLDYEEDTAGVFYIIYEEGTGSLAKTGDVAFAYYRGTLLDGKVFDENLSGLPFQFTVGQGVISGWSQGVRYFNKGTRGYLYVPSPLAYGTRSQGNGIPANSILVFNMELIELR